MTRREALLQAIEDKFKTPTRLGGSPITLNAMSNFGKVLNEDDEGRSKEKGTTLMVLEGGELYNEVISPDKLDRNLDIELRLRHYMPMGKALRTSTNEALGDLEQVVANNRTWGGLAMNTIFISNTVDREDTRDRIVEISLFIQVRYRTSYYDPTSPN